MLKLTLRLAILAMDANETHSAYLLLIKALGMATRAGKPTGNIMRSLNALRCHHGRQPGFTWR